MNVVTLLSERARTCADRLAIMDFSVGSRLRSVTFQELEATSARAASRLREAGLMPGDSVLVMVPMSQELYIVLIGILRAGLVALFLDPSAGLNHIESSCRSNCPKAFIGSLRAQWLRVLSPAIRRIPVKFAIGSKVLGASNLLAPSSGGASDRIEPRSLEDAALIRFTSGSTGEPKCSVRTHGFLLAQQHALERSLQLRPGLVDLVALPIFVLANLASGVTSIIPKANLRAPGEINAAPVIRQLLAAKPLRISASPAFLERLADYCRSTSRKLDFLQAVYTGGAPVFPHLLDQFQEMAPQAQIIAVYGSTEAEPMAQLSREGISASDREAMANGRGLLVGRPDESLRLRIRRESDSGQPARLTVADFEASCQAVGEPGEIVVSGPQVHPGEGKGTHELDRLRVDGTPWLRTGDAGYLDAIGRLWLLGRCTARIQDEFGTVYPFQVECAALRYPGVRRAALIASKGERRLVVEATKGLKETALQAQLAWSHLRRIHVVRRIPLDQRHNSKVDYDGLRKLIALG